MTSPPSADALTEARPANLLDALAIPADALADIPRNAGHLCVEKLSALHANNGRIINTPTPANGDGLLRRWVYLTPPLLRNLSLASKL